jgi:nucleotide-binding universal stress UspA family protein
VIAVLTIRKILVPTDLSKSSRAAADIAADLGARFDASIDLLHVSQIHGEGPLQEWFRRMFNNPESRKEREQIVLRRLEMEMRRHRGSPEPRIRQVDIDAERVAPTIVGYASEKSCDLIVMGTHGNRSVDHALGGTAGEVLRTANRPVMVVRSRKEDEPVNFKRILVPIDFSAGSAQAIRVAGQLAEMYGAEVTACFVAEELTVPIFSDTGIPAVNRLAMNPEDVANAGRALKKFVHEHGGDGIVTSEHVLGGQPVREITGFASSKEVDLIVMTSHGHSEPSRVTVGSVTEGVARRAPCPVLILEPEVEAG